MIDFSNFYQHLEARHLNHWKELLPDQIREKCRHGDFLRWRTKLEELPNITPSQLDFTKNTIQFGSESDLDGFPIEKFRELLKEFVPWRKGPMDLFGTFIDTEWRSDWKWNRLKDHIKSLDHKNVLDIGCGNGYHCWRMLGEGARSVIGIDPFLLSVMQFKVMKKYSPDSPVWVLPVGIEDLPNKNMDVFDSVFSMGVFYHRRSPLDHIYNLKGFMKNNAELILETLVIDGKLGEVLVPQDRYCQMRNVWFLPSILTLESWMKKCGLKNIRVVDVTKTSLEEQRATEWMDFESLKNGLDPNDLSKTVEGHPAPVRAIFIAEKN